MLVRKFAPLVLAVPIGLVMQGCGGSSGAASSVTVDRAAFIARADTVCRRMHTKMHADGSATQQEMSVKVPRMVAFRQTEIVELQKLTPPTSIARQWSQVVSGNQALERYTAAAVPYVQRKDLQGAMSLVSAGSRVEEKTFALAARMGFHDCARSG